MTRPRCATLLFAVLMIPFLFSQESSPAVAVVSEIEGKANVIMPGKGITSLKLFDWLSADSLVKVGRRSRVILAFSNGSRYELPAGSQARLLTDGVKNIAGTARILQPFPPMPHFPGIAASAQPGARAGAIRVRGNQEFKRLYPRSDSASLPESTVLMFSAMPQASRYRVVLKDQSGHDLFNIETTEIEVSIPAGIIAPGSRYSWSVEAIGKSGPVAQGYSEFLTLSSETIKGRAFLKQELEMKGDAEALVLLAAIDERLGLLLEAKRELKAALAKTNANPAIRLIIDKIESHIGSNTKPRVR